MVGSAAYVAFTKLESSDEVTGYTMLQASVMHPAIECSTAVFKSIERIAPSTHMPKQANSAENA